MTDRTPDLQEQQEEHASNSPIQVPDPGIFSYYRDDNPETGGMKVKWTIRVATGPEARRLDDRQNQAIRELLQWARQHKPAR